MRKMSLTRTAVRAGYKTQLKRRFQVVAVEKKKDIHKGTYLNISSGEIMGNFFHFSIAFCNRLCVCLSVCLFPSKLNIYTWGEMM